MAFAYYQRLSPRKRAIYRRSDAIRALEVPAVELFELVDSYHTEGFFARESSLMRQLAPAPDPEPELGGVAPKAAQLELPWAFHEAASKP